MKVTEHGFAIIERDTHISKWAMESGRLDHDQNMLPLVLKLIKPGDIVLDAGAYIGDHTIAYCKAVGKNGMVYAFEPNPEAFKCLQHNTYNFSNCLIFNKGLSSKYGNLGIVDENDNKGMAYLSKSPGDVMVHTIDSLALPRLDFMKIDVEGMEPDVLRGARDTIERCSPTMLIEVNEPALIRSGYRPKDIFDFLSDRGYSFRNVYPGQGMIDIQFDILATRK